MLTLYNAKMIPSLPEELTPSMFSAFAMTEEEYYKLLRDELGVEVEMVVTQFYNLVEDNNIKSVEFLLNTGHNVNHKVDNGNTALHAAAEHGHVSMAALLIHHGANVNVKDNKGVTPLHLACFFLQVGVVKLLLSKNANVHAKCKMGTPIVMATVSPYRNSKLNNTFDILSALVKHGANVDDKVESTGIGALHIAVKENDLKSINLLISSNVDVNVNVCKVPLLFYPIERGFVETVGAFMKVEKLDLNMKDLSQNTALHKACWIGNLNIVKILGERKYDVNAQNRQHSAPLHMALLKYRFDIAEYLLEHENIDVNIAANGNLPLHIALAFNPLGSGTTYSQREKTVISKLIENTKNLNAENDVGLSPLMCAAIGNKIEAAKHLIIKGACVNSEIELENVPKTALHLACDHKNVELVKLLLSHGAKVNNPANSLMHQPLGSGIKNGNFEIVKELQNNGAQIDQEYISQNMSKMTMCLTQMEIIERKNINDLLKLNLEFLKNVRSNRFEEVKQNLAKGACVNVSSAKYGSALIYASWKQYEEIVDLLLDQGADVNFKSATGYTSLHMACRFHTDDVIARKLLRHGAYYNLRDDKKNKTPRKHAREGGRNNLDTQLQLIDMLFRDVLLKDQEIMINLKYLKTNYSYMFELLKHVKNYRGDSLISLASDGNDSKFLQELTDVLTKD